VLSRRGLSDELITRPEESYRLWRIVVCDLETSKEEAKSPLKGCEYKPTIGCDAERRKLQTLNGTDHPLIPSGYNLISKQKVENRGCGCESDLHYD